MGIPMLAREELEVFLFAPSPNYCNSPFFVWNSELGQPNHALKT